MAKILIDVEVGIVYRVFKNGSTKPVGTRCPKGYLNTEIEGKNHPVHRLVWEHAHGSIPDGLQIDHINGNTGDNRITNLRLVTTSENCQNQFRLRVNNKSGVEGVSWNGPTGKWRAQICVNRRVKSLGYFDDFDAACECYAVSAAILHTHNPHAKKNPGLAGVTGSPGPEGRQLRWT